MEFRRNSQDKHSVLIMSNNKYKILQPAEIAMWRHDSFAYAKFGFLTYQSGTYLSDHATTDLYHSS